MARFTILFLAMVLLAQLQASVIRVDNAQAFNAAAKRAQPGDSIVMVNGTWTDAELVIEAKGTELANIYISAETPGKVLLNGKSNLRISGAWIVVSGLFFKGGALDKNAVIEFRKGSKAEAEHCRVTNCAIQDYNPAVKDTDYKWVSLYGKHNRVDHCAFQNKVHSGCLLVVWLGEKPNYHLIDSNYFGYRPELGYNGGEIIRIGTSDWSMYDSYTTVRDNYFYRCNGEHEIISNKSLHNRFTHNTFVECKGALTLRHGNYGTVNGNYFYGNGVKGTGGVRVIGENQTVVNNYFQDLNGKGSTAGLVIMNGVPNSPANRYFRVINAFIGFNTWVNCSETVEIGYGKSDELSLPAKQVTLYANVFVAKKSPVVTFTDIPEEFTWQANLFFGADAGFTVPSGNYSMDPGTVNNSNGMLRFNSLPADVTVPASFPAEVAYDIEGKLRQGVTVPGCDAGGGQKPASKPITVEDVKPVWF